MTPVEMLGDFQRQRAAGMAVLPSSPLDATGARTTPLAQRAGISKQAISQLRMAKLGKARVSRMRRDLIELAAALEELRTS